ncbi:uncharacterized protein SPPG_07743 [Spizellomyces punctatus DAOM BR117]|uniref:Cyclin N-terminal domain-containing protein n=1 Tax=Spizellomyces punctatus (strain DAOM BR117) TaxID=645134 RepID=A0A0L0H6Q0_SPIPD|nr:uncharacterized protein SPPG_07743 [Spizellomyces punctatus DAOM BR117]KNC96917.1 hypothetical protein SPPG_07743 [Spizellomyces punctatus DAOM BR117]|eukprot:XP_016604957.1 hypothetical protein SPPG_07743 [Spizellomyces punctatus DAOM BR117]
MDVPRNVNAAPPAAAEPFWQLQPQTWKRQFNMSVLSNTTVYDESCVQTQNECPATPKPISPAEIFSRKADFVESLVDTAVKLLQMSWKNNAQPSKARLVPLKIFIEEILKRSRTSFSTLQLCLLYLVRFKHHLPAYTRTLAAEAASGISTGPKKAHPSCCCRRMFLSALIVAAKYVQDRNYSNKAWSKISGLPVEEITCNEREFLRCINWKLYVSYRSFVTWSTMLLNVAHQIRIEKLGPDATGGAMLVVVGKNPDGTNRFAVHRESKVCEKEVAVQPLATTDVPLTPPTEQDVLVDTQGPQMYPSTDLGAGCYYPSPETVAGDEMESSNVKIAGVKRKLDDVGNDEQDMVLRSGQGMESMVW